MSAMADLIFAIPNIVTQKDPAVGIGAASALYEGFYKPIESWASPEEEPSIADMASYSSLITRCFLFCGFDMLRQYITDLLFFNLLYVISSASEDKYQDILDSIKLKWNDYTFTKIDTYHTFASIEAE